jgi:hypothetical protein
MFDPEPIHAALLAICQGVTGFKLVSRRLQFIDEVQPTNFPACFVVWTHDDHQQKAYAGDVISMYFKIYVYCDSGEDANAVPVKDDLLPIYKALVNAIRPVADGMKQTLGGLVESCVVSGTVDTCNGVLGGKSYAILPITVLVTD